MKKYYILILLSTCIALFSCKKENSTNSSALSVQNTSGIIADEVKCKGQILMVNGNTASSRFIPDKFFIKNGYARIYDDRQVYNTDKYYTTKFWITLPSSVNLKGDSINFEAGVKNPLNSSYFDASLGRDIKLYIKGETNAANITNVATSDIDPDASGRAAIKLGNSAIRNIPQLQHNTEDFDTLILQTFNRGVVAYRNNEYLSGLPYNKEPLIGRLKEIGIEFRGSGYIDYIKVYNSVNGKLLLSEDFNTDGESNIIIWNK